MVPMEPKSLNHMAARPAILVIAPESLMFKVLKTSVVTLAKRRLMNKAIVVRMARGTSSKKSEAAKTPEQIKAVTIIGVPSMLDIIDAKVCSCQEMGNQ